MRVQKLPVRLAVSAAVASSFLVAAPVTAGSGEAVLKNSIVLITNWGDDTVSVVDLDSGQQLSEIKVGAKPYDVKVDPSGRYAYVTNSAGTDISVIDVQAMLEAHRISVGFSPRDMAISKDGSFLVVANSGDGTLSRVDLKTGKQSQVIKVGHIPYGAQLYENEQKVVVTNWGENTVSFVDLKAGAEIAKAAVGVLPYTVVVAPQQQSTAYVTNFGSASVSRVDLKTMTTTGSLQVGKAPWGLGISADGKRLSVANFSSHDLSVIDAVAFKETARHYVGGRLNVAVAADRTKKSDALTEAEKNAPLQTARRAKNVAMSGDGKLVVWTDLANNTVQVTEAESGRTLRVINVGKAPYGITFLRKPA